MFSLFKKKENSIVFEKDSQRISYDKYKKYFDIISNDNVILEFLSNNIEDEFIKSIKKNPQSTTPLVHNLFKIQKSIVVTVSQNEIIVSIFDETIKIPDYNLSFNKCSYKPQKERDIQLIAETLKLFIHDKVNKRGKEKIIANDYGIEVFSYFKEISATKYAFKIEYHAIREMES